MCFGCALSNKAPCIQGGLRGFSTVYVPVPYVHVFAVWQRCTSYNEVRSSCAGDLVPKLPPILCHILRRASVLQAYDQPPQRSIRLTVYWYALYVHIYDYGRGILEQRQ